MCETMRRNAHQIIIVRGIGPSVNIFLKNCTPFLDLTSFCILGIFSVLKKCIDVPITLITAMIKFSLETSTFTQKFKETHVHFLKASLLKNELKNTGLYPT